MKKKRFRLSVFRSNKYIYAQIIDPEKQHTVVAASEKDIKEAGTKTQRAKLVGLGIAQKAKKEKVKDIFFDRGRFRYQGRVKALAEGAREGGLEF